MRRVQSTIRDMAVLILIGALGACGGPPELPPADTMEMQLFKQDPASGALTSADQGATTVNVDSAAGAVWLVSTAVWLVLAVPRATFAGTLTAEATNDGDWWVWDKTFALLGWDSQLRAKGTDGVDLEMRITGLRGDDTAVQNFLWYTGHHELGQGEWVFYEHGVEGETLRIDWTRDAADDKELVFTNVRADSAKLDDQLTYAIEGTLATMTVHDENSGDNDDGPAAEFSVTWDVDSGVGKWTRVNGDELCWDTIANGQADMPTCPSDWP